MAAPSLSSELNQSCVSNIKPLYQHHIRNPCFVHSEPIFSPFSGSHIENWHSILRNGLVNASYTKLQVEYDNKGFMIIILVMLSNFMLEISHFTFHILSDLH